MILEVRDVKVLHARLNKPFKGILKHKTFSGTEDVTVQRHIKIDSSYERVYTCRHIIEQSSRRKQEPNFLNGVY